MAQYNLSHTGQQLDAAVEKYLQVDFNSFVDSATLNNYVTNTALNTTLEDYLNVNDAASTYLPLTGGALTGALTLANGTLNNIGDDVAIGDVNQAGALGIKGLNGTTNLRFIQHNATAAGTLSWDGSKFAFSNLLNITANSNTVTIGSQNTDYCHFINSANIPFYFNKTVYVDGNILIYNNYAYSLQRGGVGTAWVGGRNGALVKTTTISGYSATCSIKTTNGSWEIGAYDNSGYANQLIFSYVTDSNFNANNNTNVTARITPAGAFTNASKREYKENIKLVDYSALDIINSTKICSFNMKGDEEKAYRVGFIADDTNPIISGKNQDVMDLQNCIGILMKAVQELSSKIDKKNK